MAFRSFFNSSPKNSYTKPTKQYIDTYHPERDGHSNTNSPERDRRTFSSFPSIIAVTTIERDSMKQDILDTVSRRSQSIMGHGHEKDNPLYEDPKDVIEKPVKPPRKRNLQGPVVSADTKSLMREQRRKLTQRYEGLITTLIQRCEDNVAQMSEKESQIAKLKEKLKTVLEYNRLFADENDKLKTQYEAMINHVEECKRALNQEEERNRELDKRCKELEERICKFEIPDRDDMGVSGIPLVEVCMSCARSEIAVSQCRQQAARACQDMRAMKDVLYRLNIQLSRYQEKLRQHPLTPDCKDAAYKPGDRYDGPDSLITASVKDASDGRRSKSPEGTRTVGVSGLLSAQALAPLFDAYQENLQEKDNLILDYEKQLENINKKTKEIVAENKSLSERVNSLEEELVKTRQSYKRMLVEKETDDIEKATLVERAERAEFKLKEVYECYEDKISAMMRDYETVHREYFAVKHALEASEGKVAAIDVLRARTVPADLHERRLEHCKRLLEELKHQYTMESERKAEHTKKVEEELKALQEKHNQLIQEHQTAKEELRAALKNAKLYRKAAVIFRDRARACSARLGRVRRGVAKKHGEPLRQAVDTLTRIKQEIKVVKTRAHTSLEELERRIVEQERRASLAQAEYRRELERASITIEHKEGIIRSLIDRVADFEQSRLNQNSTHRPEDVVSPDHLPIEKKQTKPGVKLVPGPGGYFQDKKDKS